MCDSACDRLAGPFTTRRDGFAAFGLRTEALELVVVPELGANICSLRSARSGREWLWRPSGALFKNRWGDPFERGPLTGAVECVPTIAACTVLGRKLPDHGEAWTARWEIDESAFRDGCIRTFVRLPVSGLHLSRSIRLDGPMAHFDYRIDNPAREAMPYLWAFHPLISVESGDRLELPPSICRVHVATSQGYPGLAATGTWGWPAPRPGVRLDRVGDGPPGSFVKLFAGFVGLSEGWSALCRGAERLEFRFDPGEIPHLGLWLTHGGWHGCTHLAIEPASDMTDSLTGICRNHLPASGGRCWNFDIRLTEAI
jgi:hypothetical protein